MQQTEIDKNRERNISGWKHHIMLFTVVVPASFLFLLAIWSPPVMYHNPAEWYGNWQQLMFATVCHQQPDRTFIIGGIPLAACIRCTGIFSGLFAGLLLFSPFPDFVKKTEHYIIRIFIAFTIILMIDGVANLVQLWHTAPGPRLMTGVFWGVSISTVLILALAIPRTARTQINRST